MDEIAHKLLAVTFRDAEANREALRVMLERIGSAAKKPGGGTITYSDLVAGVQFRKGDRLFAIGRRGFTPNNRRFLSSLLGHLSKDTYLTGNFFAGAMVVDKKTQEPGRLFYRFAREMGVQIENNREAEREFWKSQRLKAHEYFSRGDESSLGLLARVQLPEFLSRSGGGGDYIRLAGHRIGLTQVIEFYQRGYSAEMIREQFPSLSLALIYKVLAFYLEGQEWIDRLVNAERARVARQRAEAVRQAPALEQMRQRLRDSREVRVG